MKKLRVNMTAHFSSFIFLKSYNSLKQNCKTVWRFIIYTDIICDNDTTKSTEVGLWNYTTTSASYFTWIGSGS